MSVGFRISLFVDDKAETPDLPDHFLVDDHLEETLSQLTKALRTWIEKNASNASPEASSHHLNLSIFGPFEKDFFVIDQRSPDQRIAEADSPKALVEELSRATKEMFEAERFDESRAYLARLKSELLTVKDNDATAVVAIVSGRFALREGRIDEAKQFLLEAGQTEGSPVMGSFGPNMSLARDLLLAGEEEAVLAYFEACRTFWKMGGENLDTWTNLVKAGLFPDFRANLIY